MSQADLQISLVAELDGRVVGAVVTIDGEQRSIEARRGVEGGVEGIEGKLPAVIGCDPETAAVERVVFGDAE